MFIERARAMKRSNLRRAFFVIGISLLPSARFIPHTMGAPPTNAEVAGSERAPGSVAEFSNQAKALPFPADARDVEFDKTFKDIEFTSRSSLASLVDFYQREMQKRGWGQDAAALVQEKERVKMTFKHEGEKIEIELRQSSNDVDVSMDCEGLDFGGADDPAGLLAAGVPQPRSYLYLQKEVPRPESVRDVEYRSDECHFKAPLALQAAFDYYLKTLQGLGWRETRRPIVTKDRRYTEFKRGPIKLSVNIFSHDVRSRIILGYEDDRKEPLIPPLPAVASTLRTVRSSESVEDKKSEAMPKPSVDVSTNTGSATVTQGADKYVFKHVAAYQTKNGGDKTTTLVFSDRPIPLQRMQQMLAMKDDFSFDDLYEGSLPGCLRIQVNEHTSFYFTAQAVVVGDSLDDPERDLKIEQGRIRGTIKMRQPKVIFSEPFHLAATIDAAVLTPNTNIGQRLK